MLIEEEEPKGGDLNPDALEAVFEEEIIDEEVIIYHNGGDDSEDADELDIAFYDDEGNW